MQQLHSESPTLIINLTQWNKGCRYLGWCSVHYCDIDRNRVRVGYSVVDHQGNGVYAQGRQSHGGTDTYHGAAALGEGACPGVG